MAEPTLLWDGFTVVAGMDGDREPSRTDPFRATLAVNATFRGRTIGPRPGWHKVPLAFGDDPLVAQDVQSGTFQAAHVYEPETGEQVIIASISGRLFRFAGFESNAVNVTDVSIKANVTVTTSFNVPPVGSSVTVEVDSVANLADGQILRMGPHRWEIVSINAGPPPELFLRNLDNPDVGDPIAIGTLLTAFDTNPATNPEAWFEQAEKWLVLQNGQNFPIIFDGATSRRSAVGNREVPPGRQMSYGDGRLWVAGVDGISFFGGDLVGGPSGTPAERFRDSVIKFEDNTLLANGGSFAVPSRAGKIRAMRHTATQDVALGHGPLQVFTENMAFSVAAPPDRTQWASVTYPIQTVSLVNSGAEGQRNTLLVNSDVWYRSKDGVRSMILARRDFGTWSNTPQSTEIREILRLDSTPLLQFGSAVVFDNRLLMTVVPQITNQGCIHRGLAVLDLDPLSNIGEKQPPHYDGLWIGLHIYQILVGRFAGEDRCFAFCRNQHGELELYEITKEDPFDRNDMPVPTRIVWTVELAAMTFRSEDGPGGEFRLKRLHGGELHAIDYWGDVDFDVKFRPEGQACWIDWHRWHECAGTNKCAPEPWEQFQAGACWALTMPVKQMRPATGLPQPPDVCDPITNRPYRTAVAFQVRLQVRGYCKFLRGRFGAYLIDQPSFAPVVCNKP